MKHNFGMAQQKIESAKNTDQSRVEFEQTASSRSLEQINNQSIAGKAKLLAYEHSPAFAPQPAHEIQAEATDSYRPHDLRMAVLRENYLRQVIKRVEEHEAAMRIADGTRPEVERMLQKVLAVGGEEVIKWLKAQDAKIAASPPCIEPEMGRMIQAYYVPLLLSALALDDEEFNAEYPGESSVSSKERGELVDAILDHAEGCQRCSIKFTSDWYWDEHLNKVFTKERTAGGAKETTRFEIKV